MIHWAGWNWICCYLCFSGSGYTHQQFMTIIMLGGVVFESLLSNAQECGKAWGQAWGKYLTFPVGRFWLVISTYWSSDKNSRKCWSNCFQINTNHGVRLLFGCFIWGCYSSRNFITSPPLVLLQNSNSWLVHVVIDFSVDWFQES